ncbi:hypothetical protein KL938_004504 [Ogataea parapolymorpha]|nr:hypothetical protein KL938_004504 [Ogataea parapolymorpha]
MRAQDNGASHLLSEAEAEIALCRGSDNFVEESADGDNIKRTEALDLVLDVDDRAVIQLEQLLGVRVTAQNVRNHNSCFCRIGLKHMVCTTGVDKQECKNPEDVDFLEQVLIEVQFVKSLISDQASQIGAKSKELIEH